MLSLFLFCQCVLLDWRGAIDCVFFFLLSLPVCTAIAGDAFYIHEHFSASTQAIYSLVAVILASWEIIPNDLVSTSLQCGAPLFRFMALCTSNDCKFAFFVRVFIFFTLLNGNVVALV